MIPRRNAFRRYRLFIIAWLLMGPGFIFAARAARGDVLPDGFAYRRPLNFKQYLSDAPGQNAAVAEFYTNGQAKPDGADLRVTTADRVIVPHRILQISPTDDFVRIAFATAGNGPYYVWWGNPKAEAPAKPLEIKRGIYTEIYKTPPGAVRDVRTADGLDKLFQRAKPEGAVFVPEIFLAYNPLGEEWGTMFHYTTQFKIDTAITADFAFTVANSGTLAIDGKIIAREIRTGMKGRVRDPKSVDLSVGWHTMDVTQVNLDGGQDGVVVAWKRPGERNYAPLPAAVFAPIAQASAGPLEKVSAPGSFTADFAIVPEAESFSPPESYMQRYTFEADIPSTFTPVITWDFGDGQTSKGLKRIGHIYLGPGNYTVTLKVEQGTNAFTAVRRITIKDRMYAKFPLPPEDPPRTVIAVLRDYNPAKLTGDQALRGLMYFQERADTEDTLAWGKAWLAMKDAPRGRVAFDEAFDLARLFEERKDYKQAVEAFRLAAAKPVGIDLRLELMRYEVMTACDFTDDADAAFTEAQSWLKTVNETSKEQLRAVRTAMLYAAVAKGDAKAAQAALDQITEKDPAIRGAAYNEAQIRQGVLARNIENYIRTRDFETAFKLINDWDAEFPEAIWDGFTRTLRVKLYIAEGKHAIAARIALQHARANPSGFYAAELLYRAAQEFKAAGDATQSKSAMDVLTSKYPESPYARGDAKEK